MGNDTRMTMGQALACPDFEIMPLKNGMEAVSHLPAGSVVAVTCSPAQGVDGTVAFAARLQEMGFRTVAHLAARRIVDRDHLQRILRQMDAAGIRHVFVISGDRTDVPGVFASGLELIRELREGGADLDSIGIPCYPEGHAFIDDDVLDQALVAKSEYADYMVSQICFNAKAILDWQERVLRELDVTLPLYVGVPGVIARTKLLGIAMRIGIGDSLHFLRRNTGLIGGLISGSKYRPDQLIQALSDGYEQRPLNLGGVHINTFNQVAATEAWRGEQLASLRAKDVASLP